MATEEITISELELADEVLADMTLPVDTATETRAVTLKQLRAWLGSALPVGSVFASVGRLDDERFTLLDGKTISRIGTYEAFCNKVVEKVQAGTWKACTEEEFNLEVSETGQCGKFVVSNDYVRIPKLGNSLCSGVIDGKIPVVGNGYGLGLTNGTNEGTLTQGTIYAGTNFSSSTILQGIVDSNLDNYSDTTAPYPYTANPKNIQNGSLYGGVEGVLGITSNPIKSGIEGKINYVEVFYYMVISTEGQTASVEIDINKIYEDLNIKANSDLSNVASNIDYVIESWRDAHSWYKVYKSGWVEQGGFISNAGTSTVNFFKPFRSMDYSVYATLRVDAVDSSYAYTSKVRSVANSYCTIYNNASAFWRASGQGK